MPLPASGYDPPTRSAMVFSSLSYGGCPAYCIVPILDLGCERWKMVRA